MRQGVQVSLSACCRVAVTDAVHLAAPSCNSFVSMLLQVRVNLWDLAGSPDYLDVRNEFYKDSQAALLVRQQVPQHLGWSAQSTHPRGLGPAPFNCQTT